MDKVALISLCCLLVGAVVVHAEDPYIYFTWNVTYGTISPLGVPQKGILINGQFPGPTINSTTNNNVIVNVFNNLNEDFLLTWSGVQHRKNSWQDGTLGTNCPIPAGTNYTYRFQVKDQIGSYFYYPTTSVHRAAGGFGGLNVHSRDLIPVPYPTPEDEYYVLINDWYTQSLDEIKSQLDSGRPLGRPDGVLINGHSGKETDAKVQFTMKPGKTYRYRICNVGLKSSLNIRIQGHTMKLVELEGSHVVQNVYDSLDVHVGQCMAVLVTADQEPKDYYMVVSTRFLKEVKMATTLIRYVADGKAPVAASKVLPEAPTGWAYSLNQFRTFRWNLTASAARPNPQGSYHYGQINITRTIKLVNTASKTGKLRHAINGVSHVYTSTPLKLAQYYGIADKHFKYGIISDDPKDTPDVKLAPNVFNITFRTFVEIILENHENSIHSYHLDGYSFFAVAMEPGKWAPEKRKNYNLLDAVSRYTVQVLPHSWSAIMLTFDNAGMWNLRSELLENRYLGQELYISVQSPERSLRDEYNMPDNNLLCGDIKSLPKPAPFTV